MEPIRAALRLALAFGIALLTGCATPTAMVPLRQEGGEAAEVIRNYREAMARQRAHAESEAERLRNHQRSLEDLLRQGDQLRDGGDYAPALFAYLRAHTRSYDDIVPRLRIGFLHLREEPVRAEAVFRKILAGAPGSAIGWTGLALAYIAQSRPDEARESLERAVALDPAAPVPHSILGVLLDRSGRHPEAQSHYQLALRAEPEDFVVLNNLGVSYLLSNRPDLAVEPLRKASYLEPRDTALRNNLGLALGLVGEPAAALASFRAAGSESAAQNNLGWAHYLRGDPAAALACFEKALDAEGDDLLVVLRNIDLARSALENAPRRPARRDSPAETARSAPRMPREAAPPHGAPPVETLATQTGSAPQTQPLRRDRAEDQISVADLRAALEPEPQRTPAEHPKRPAPPPEIEAALEAGLPVVDESLDFGGSLDEGSEIDFDWEDDFGSVEDEPTA